MKPEDSKDGVVSFISGVITAALNMRYNYKRVHMHCFPSFLPCLFACLFVCLLTHFCFYIQYSILICPIIGGLMSSFLPIPVCSTVIGVILLSQVCIIIAMRL